MVVMYPCWTRAKPLAAIPCGRSNTNCCKRAYICRRADRRSLVACVGRVVQSGGLCVAVDGLQRAVVCAACTTNAREGEVTRFQHRLWRTGCAWRSMESMLACARHSCPPHHRSCRHDHAPHQSFWKHCQPPLSPRLPSHALAAFAAVLKQLADNPAQCSSGPREVFTCDNDAGGLR